MVKVQKNKESGLTVNVSLSDTKIFETLVAVLKKFSNDTRIDEDIREEYMDGFMKEVIELQCGECAHAYYKGNNHKELYCGKELVPVHMVQRC